MTEFVHVFDGSKIKVRVVQTSPDTFGIMVRTPKTKTGYRPYKTTGRGRGTSLKVYSTTHGKSAYQIAYRIFREAEGKGIRAIRKEVNEERIAA